MLDLAAVVLVGLLGLLEFPRRGVFLERYLGSSVLLHTANINAATYVVERHGCVLNWICLGSDTCLFAVRRVEQLQWM